MEQLVIDLQNKDSSERAFRELLEIYQKRLYYHVRRYVNNHDDAHDVLQQTFIKVHQSIANFRGDCSLYSWLYRIAGNEALTFIAKNKKHQNIAIENRHYDVQKTNNNLNAEQIQEKLTLALATLPEKQKQVFILRYYDEMPYEQMSEILETSVGALKASYHHAAKKIEEFILSY